MDRGTLSAGGDQPFLPQQREMPGEVGLGKAEPPPERARRELALEQTAQDHQPVATGEGTQESLGLDGAGLHPGRIEL